MLAVLFCNSQGEWLFEELVPQNKLLILMWCDEALDRLSQQDVFIEMAGYRCEAKSVEGFVQQLASCYLRHGYWWYVSGVIPEWKSVRAVDAKLIQQYDIGISESTRARRKRLGKANLQYLRYDQFFVILATQGDHPFRERESGAIRDIRRVPLKFHGYSISYRPGGRTRSGERDPKWHSHVEIERARYKELRDYLLELAAHRSPERLALAFYRIPFEPYAPVRRQMLNMLRAVNRRRKTAGYSLLPKEVLPLRRRVVKPFGETLAESVETSVEDNRGVDEDGELTEGHEVALSECRLEGSDDDSDSGEH